MTRNVEIICDNCGAPIDPAEASVTVMLSVQGPDTGSQSLDYHEAHKPAAIDWDQVPTTAVG